MATAKTRTGPPPRVAVATAVENSRSQIVAGHAEPRGYGVGPRLSPEASAAFATYVDSARVRAAIEGRILVYVVRWK